MFSSDILKGERREWEGEERQGEGEKERRRGEGRGKNREEGELYDADEPANERL